MAKKLLSYDERHARSRHRYGLCIPTRRCHRFTPSGEIDGMECPVGDTVYHNTTLSGAASIAEDGHIKVTDKGALGQDAISLSPCPAQHYGGNVKLVVDTKGLELRPTCYYEYEGANKDTDHGFENEARQERNGSFQGVNRIRAKHGVNLDMYNEECEVISYKDIPTKKVKRVEFWVPWRVDERNTFSTKCVGSVPSYAHGEFGDVMGKLQFNIATARDIARKMGAKFAVKSCFTALQTDSWGDRYVPLDKKNLSLLARGKAPVEKKTPMETRTDKIYGVRRVKKLPEKCKC